MSSQSNAHDSLRVELAHALGFPEYPDDVTADPYLNYITNRFVGRGTLEGHIKLFISIIQYFEGSNTDTVIPPATRSIQGFLDTLCRSNDDPQFSDTEPGSQARRDDVEDTVMYAIGTWTMLLSSFVHVPASAGLRIVTVAFTLRAPNKGVGYHPYQETLSDLIKASGLLPIPRSDALLGNTMFVDMKMQLAKQAFPLLSGRLSLDEALYGHSSSRFFDNLNSLESLSIDATRLNAYTLKVFGAVDIEWTHNLSRHLLLSKRNGRHVFEVFALPCALEAYSLNMRSVGITSEFAQEVRESYCLLLNAWSITPLHAKFGTWIGVHSLCWCWSCSAQRHRKRLLSAYTKFSERKLPRNARVQGKQCSEYDPLLIELTKNETSDWTPHLFPSLWPRIMALEEHLQGAKPWSIWVLFQDRRDTLQFWTFFFATIVVLLTLLQVLLSIAQVVGSFMR